MFFSKDREQLNAAKEENYVDACRQEFEEKSVNDSNRRLAKTLTAWSYLPNAISLITACFFIFYLLTAYALWVKIVLGLLLLAVAAAVELGKRGLINEAGKRYFPTERIPSLLIIGALILMICSMTGSYIGGNKLVTENASLPPKEVNPKIDSLKAQLAHELTVSESFRKTTWKGKITRAATKGMNASRTEQNRLNAKIDELEKADDEAYATLLSQHNSKTMNFGIVLGIIAIIADAALFFLLWTVKKMRYEIALLAVKASQKAKAKAKKKKQAKADIKGAGRSIGYRPGSSGGAESRKTTPPLPEKEEPKPARIVHEGGLKDGYTPFKIPKDDDGNGPVITAPLDEKVTVEPDDVLELKPLQLIHRSAPSDDVLELDDGPVSNGPVITGPLRARDNGPVKVELKPGERICEYCGQVYEYKAYNQKFCRKKCKAAFHTAKHGGIAFNPKIYKQKK